MKKKDPLWQLISNSGSLNRMLPVLEAILSKLKSPELAERAEVKMEILPEQWRI